MRLSVQLREPGAGEGKRWQRSVYLDSTPRNVTVFVDDSRPPGEATGAPPIVAALDSLLLVVDTINTPPGSKGTVWLDGLRLESGGK